MGKAFKSWKLKGFEFGKGKEKKTVENVIKYKYPDGTIRYIGEIYNNRGKFKFGPSRDCNSKEDFEKYVKNTFSGLNTKQDMYHAAVKSKKRR